MKQNLFIVLYVAQSKHLLQARVKPLAELPQLVKLTCCFIALEVYDSHSLKARTTGITIRIN